MFVCGRVHTGQCSRVSTVSVQSLVVSYWPLTRAAPDPMDPAGSGSSPDPDPDVI